MSDDDAQARKHAQEIYVISNLIRNALDAGIYYSAEEKIPLLGQEIAELSEALNRLRLLEQPPPDYEHPEDQEHWSSNLGSACKKRNSWPHLLRA